MKNHKVAIRPDLQVTLDDGNGIVLERVLAPGTKVKMTFDADEWQEIADLVRAIRLLAEGYQGRC